MQLQSNHSSVHNRAQGMLELSSLCLCLQDQNEVDHLPTFCRVSPFTASQTTSNILGNGISFLRSAPARRHSRGKLVDLTKGIPRPATCFFLSFLFLYASHHSSAETTICTPQASIATLAAVPAPSSPPAVAVFAVVVGWLVIAGSLFRSVPQISRILKNKR